MSTKCPKCNTENTEDSQFCKKCATPLKVDVGPTKTLETPIEELKRGSVFAGRYEIIEELGKGGMGSVYRVEDIKAKEEIALKLIKPEIASDKKTIERFRNELTTARKIVQKNVCRMYDLGEEKGLHFITMEYISGQDLKGLIRQTGQLTVGKSISIAKQICDGLAEAHSLGVVHRDLKPNNIMIDPGGNAKIMDFGIARAVKGKSITGAGVVIGTPQYMSPEQVEGKEVDQRSDIYSLGIILYEMLTDQVPFDGDTPLAVGVKQKIETPKDPKVYNERIPDNLNQLILKCLEKEKEKRYLSAEELKLELEKLEQGLPTTDRIVPRQKIHTSKEITVTFRRRWVLISSLFAVVILVGLALLFFSKREDSSIPDKKRIVVLPFENLGSKVDDYFANGIAFEIMARLSGIPGLSVIDQSSAIQYKNTNKSIQDIAGELGVDVILKGTASWQKSSDGTSRIRVMPQLINVSDAKQIWANVYDKEMSDIFQVQSDIARQVVEALDIALLEPARRIIDTKPTENIEAYQAYLRGLDYQQNPDDSEEILRLRLRMFERAVEIDPGFALAHAALSRSYSILYHDWLERNENCLTLAKTAADRAFELQPDLAEAHIALGYYFYHGLKDYIHALEQFSIALEKEPQDSETLSAIGYVQRRQGLFDLSLENQKKAFGMSPRDAQKAGIIARTYTFVRNYKEAENYMNLSISLGPDQVNSYLDKAVNYWLWKGDTDKAREALDNIPQRDSSLAVYHWILLELYERDYPAAQERISLSPVESFETEWYFISKAQLAGQVYDLMNQPEEANASYKTALAFLEEIAQKKPSDPRIHSSIGISKAGLGLKSNAIAEGKLGVELYPVLKDTLCGPTRVKDLALIYTLVGEYDAALDQIDYLLSIPSFMSVQLLNLDPRWDPLRDHPRFALIIEKYSE